MSDDRRIEPDDIEAQRAHLHVSAPWLDLVGKPDDFVRGAFQAELEYERGRLRQLRASKLSKN